MSLKKRRSQNIDPFQSKKDPNTQLLLSSLCTSLRLKDVELFHCDSKADLMIDFVSLRPSAGDSKGIEDMDMNAVRLCFQCELEWDDGRKDCLSPVVSNPVYDKSKTHHHKTP